MSIAFLLVSNFSVHGQSQSSVTITGVSSQGQPLSFLTVEQPVSLTGTITTYNGPYQVYFSSIIIATGNAVGYNVVSNFTIPDYPAGDYQFTLIDLTTGENTTSPFPIFVAYAVNAVIPASPGQLQEGQIVDLNVSVLGGDANSTYVAEISVQPPSGISQNYTADLPLTTASDGAVSVIVPFPGTSFSPAGASTDYYGAYAVYFNESLSLASSTFAVGFTDATVYHRGQTVFISALGYQPNQVTTVAIDYGALIVFSQTVTANSQGTVTTDWVIPSNTTIGSYTVEVTPLTTPSKIISDVETFQIPGYTINFYATNLAGEAVPQISVEALDQSTGSTYTGTTDSTGMATINLEKGGATVDAYWNQAEVANVQISVTANATIPLSCRLTDLQIKVQDTNGVAIPFVDLNITYSYPSQTGETLTGTAAGQTDVTGFYSFNSTLPGIGYTILASKYNTVFNSGNTQISPLAAQPSTQVTILCPDEGLTLKTVDYNYAPLPNARITLIEQASGIFYSVTTDSNGNAQLPVTFGQYQAEVYTSSNVLLNTTVLSVLNDTTSQIRCVAYNLPVSVKVVDFFGNGIANVNVQITRPGLSTLSANTQSNGVASFGDIIGGNVVITAYPPGNANAYIAASLKLDSATTVTLTMGKYVDFAGALISTSALATIIIIILAVLLFVGIEVYRRTGFKLKRKTET